METVHAYQCTRKPKGMMVELQTRRAFRPDCGAYHCQNCGPRKARRLASGIVSEFKDAKIRLLTLTATNAFNNDSFDLCVEAWKVFSRLFRASHVLTAKMRACRYVRLVERHKSGWVHLHLIVDQYLPVRAIQALWDEACRTVLRNVGAPTSRGKICNAHIRGMKTGFDHKTAARYVTKYVTKEAHHTVSTIGSKKARSRPYSASRSVSVWREWRAKRVVCGRWVYVPFSAIREAGELYSYIPSLIPGEDWQGNCQVINPALYNVLFEDEFAAYD